MFKLDFAFVTDLIPNSNSVASEGMDYTVKQTNSQLAAMGYKSGSMLDNHLFFFISMAIIAVLHFFHDIVMRKCRKDNIENVDEGDQGEEDSQRNKPSRKTGLITRVKMNI